MNCFEEVMDVHTLVNIQKKSKSLRVGERLKVDIFKLTNVWQISFILATLKRHFNFDREADTVRHNRSFVKISYDIY